MNFWSPVAWAFESSKFNFKKMVSGPDVCVISHERHPAKFLDLRRMGPCVSSSGRRGQITVVASAKPN